MKICLFTINAKGFNLPPYGVWVIKAYIDQYKKELPVEVDVNIFSFDYGTTQQDVINTLATFQPDLIGISHYIWNDEPIISVIEDIKQHFPNTKVVIGGPHADIKDQRLRGFLENYSLDAIIVGEGEEPFYHIIRTLIKNNSIEPAKGILCYQNGSFNNFTPQVTTKGEVDYLPNPYRVSSKLLTESLDSGSIQYETSRGCPFTCTFCDQGHKAYRSLSMNRIKDDLQFFALHNPKHIDFLDGTFNLSPQRTVEILNYMIDLNSGWSIHAEIKPENLTIEEIELMKRANFKSVELGLQSIHANTLKQIKRRNDYRRIEETVTNLNKYGIEVTVNTIIGLPGETIYHWFESIDYCFSLGKAKIISNLLKLLPNTVLLDQKDQFGYEYDISKYNSIVKSSGFSNQELRYALAINKMIDSFWNNIGMPEFVKLIVQSCYKNKFHLFLVDALESLMELTNSRSLTTSFHFEVMMSVLQKIEKRGDIIMGLKEGVEKHFAMGGMKVAE